MASSENENLELGVTGSSDPHDEHPFTKRKRACKSKTMNPRQGGSEPNYVVDLLAHHLDRYDRHQIVSLMSDLEYFPDNFTIHASGIVGSSFEYKEWHKVLGTLVYLWNLVLQGRISFTPKLVQNLLHVPSDTEELDSRLRVLFKERVVGLLEKCHHKRQVVEKELLGRLDMLPNKIAVRRLIIGKIGKFMSGMECVLEYLNGKLKLGGKFDWSKIYWMIKRECRRLVEGLPIYAHCKDSRHQAGSICYPFYTNCSKFLVLDHHHYS